MNVFVCVALLFPTAIQACAIIGRCTLNNRKRRMFRHASRVVVFSQYMIYIDYHMDGSVIWFLSTRGIYDITHSLATLARLWYHICHSCYNTGLCYNRTLATLARSWYHICHSLIKIISHCHPCDNLYISCVYTKHKKDIYSQPWLASVMTLLRITSLELNNVRTDSKNA